MTRSKRLIFILVAMMLPVVLAVGALFGIDLSLHRLYENTSVVNIWGYRGARVARKRPGERRVVYLGGSTAFGYGVLADEAIPALLERNLNRERPAGAPPISVINLAYNNEGAYSFKFTLNDYLYLDYDVACLYEGYNDLLGDEQPNRFVLRHSSLVFRLTGYLPIFPMVFREKAAAIRYGGNIDALYNAGGHAKTVFGQPSLVNRAVANTLEATVAVSRSLDAQLERIGDGAASDPDSGGAVCESPWSHYCRWMLDAVDVALAHNKRVVVITQPYLKGKAGERHRAQQHAIATTLLARYSGDTRVRYVNLGDVIDLGQISLTYDGMHLTTDGNRVIAARLTKPILAALP